ncbi:MAG TPA: hypothetical protein VIK78_21380 [Ruminiclostridium sp.]
MKDKATRQILIEKTEAALKKPSNDATTGIRVGKIINKYNVGKLLTVEIKDGKVTLERNESMIRKTEALDGLYVIYTDVKGEEMNISEVVQTYRKLIGVEQAFRKLKTAQLVIRPIYHKTDDRIRCHVFLCISLLFDVECKATPCTTFRS